MQSIQGVTPGRTTLAFPLKPVEGVVTQNISSRLGFDCVVHIRTYRLNGIECRVRCKEGVSEG